LTERTYELLERNYRTRFGELDLILRHANTLMKVHGTKAIS
jgi:Holliday junction resolvase-like predicted endonuclease